MSKQIIVGYKAFNHDLTCRDFHYEVSKTYTLEGDIKICEKGFHFCSNFPFDVLNFYPIIDENGEMIRFARVSSPLSKTFSENSKTVTSTITIVEELSFHDLVDEQICQTFMITGKDTRITDSDEDTQMAASGDFAQINASNAYTQMAATGDYVKSSASGDYAQMAASGNHSQMAASGDYTLMTASGNHAKMGASGDDAQMAASGDDAQMATSGGRAKMAASGDYVKMAASGDRAKMAATGDYVKMAASGNHAKMAASGNYVKMVATGENSVIAISGLNGCFKGINGTFVSCADFGGDGKCTGFVSGCVGQDGLRENTWYTVRNGKFIECEVQLC